MNLSDEQKKMLSKRQGLTTYNAVIQICQLCGKVDAYAGDNHDCDYEYRERMREDANG